VGHISCLPHLDTRPMCNSRPNGHYISKLASINKSPGCTPVPFTSHQNFSPLCQISPRSHFLLTTPHRISSARLLKTTSDSMHSYRLAAPGLETTLRAARQYCHQAFSRVCGPQDKTQEYLTNGPLLLIINTPQIGSEMTFKKRLV